MKQPAKSVPALLELRKSLLKIGDEFWVPEKISQLDGIIGGCLGLHLEAVAEKSSAQPGESLNMQIEAINRSDRAGDSSKSHAAACGREPRKSWTPRYRLTS